MTDIVPRHGHDEQKKKTKSLELKKLAKSLQNKKLAKNLEIKKLPPGPPKGESAGRGSPHTLTLK